MSSRGSSFLSSGAAAAGICAASASLIHLDIVLNPCQSPACAAVRATARRLRCGMAAACATGSDSDLRWLKRGRDTDTGEPNLGLG